MFIAKAAPALCMRMHSLKIGLENITEEVQRGVAIAESMTLRTAGFRRVV